MLLLVRRPHAAPSRPASHPRASSSLGLRSRQVDRALRGATVARASPAATDAALGRRAVVGMALAVSLCAPAYCRAPPPSASALTEENLLFLEAWRAVDRAYYDKSFNGQSWFRYRERALREDPMNTREETYAAIKKMLATLDDPFTRFLEPEKFKSLRSGTQGALTGVGLSIGYPLALNGSPTGLSVMSAAPGGPAEKAGIVSGDVILAIDNTSAQDMDIYDAADRLQKDLAITKKCYMIKMQC